MGIKANMSSILTLDKIITFLFTACSPCFFYCYAGTQRFFFIHGHLCTRIAVDLKLVFFLLGNLLNIVSKAVFLILCFGTKVHVSGWYFVSNHANVFSVSFNNFDLLVANAGRS